MRTEFNISQSLDVSYSRVVMALQYANLLALHAHDAIPHLTEEPGIPTFELDFRTDNLDVPKLAKSQFGDEVSRYALVYALAHYDRFVLELAVLDGVVRVAVEEGGRVSMGAAQEIEQAVLTVRRNQSVAQELDRLGGGTSQDLAAGINWFRGLYAIRNCLVHRAGIVGFQDKRLLSGITWRRFALVHNGEELSGGFPRVLAAGTIDLRISDSGRSWKLGERVQLSLEDIKQMMYSLFQLSVLVVHHLNRDFTERLAVEHPERAVTGALEMDGAD